MIDIKFIREFPAKFDTALQSRGISPLSKQILALDEEIRKATTDQQHLQSERNEVAREIGKLKSTGQNADSQMQRAEEIKTKLPAFEKRVNDKNQELEDILLYIPNICADEVPVGADENGNVEIKKVGTPRSYDFTPKEHFDLGEALKMMDFEQTAKISGARFVTLKSHLARMERALANFMLDIHTKEFGFLEVCPPVLVRQDAMYGTGQYPKLAEDSFKTAEGYYLVPTSEVSLTNLVADKILLEQELPMRLTAFTNCFRSEAGSAGKDTKGMIRMHQFSKVEMVSITSEKESKDEHERMLSAAETILKRLDIPYRVMLLCTGDIGFAANKTYDIEVWLPGQDRYREISSCSNCGDFQARRLKARYKALSDKKNSLVHTLNGSGLAIGRTIIAIMENYQNADGSISIPPNLQPYVDGLKKIEMV